MGLRIDKISSKRDLMEFIKYPMQLYRDDPCFVPHLIFERKDFFSSKNPLFEFTDVEYFLARNERGECIGRITAHINKVHNEFTNENTGFFGFFECIDSFEVAESLVQKAEASLRQRGMSVIRGPFNFSTNEECGFKVDGFDKPPMIMMTHTKPYYIDFFERMGYQKSMDLLAYDYKYHGAIPDHLVRFAERAGERYGVTVRSMNMKKFSDEVKTVFKLYNAAWEKNWGFVPMTAAEFDYAAKSLKSIVDPDLTLIAEKEGRPVGFALSLPDYNVLFKKANGNLFPKGLWHMLTGRRKINQVRVILLGVIEEVRSKGIDALLYYTTFKNGTAKGYFSCEMSWILENNAMMRRAAERMGAVVGKTYRIFEKSL